MAIIDSRGLVDDGTANLVVAGTTTLAGVVSYTGYSSALKVSTWYIDFVSGSDSNSGLTSGSALKTFMGGLVAKWGTSSPILSQSVTINVLSSQPVGAEVIVLQPIIGGPYNFSVVGTLVSSSLVTLNVVQPKVRTTNQQFIANGFLSSSKAGQLVKNTTHPSECFIRRILTGSAQLTQPLLAMNPGDNVYNPSPVEVDTWAHNDAVQVYDLPAINLQTFNVTAGSSSDASTNPAAWLKHLRLLDYSASPGNSVISPKCQAGYLTIADCYIEPYLADRGESYNMNVVNCVNNGFEPNHGTWIIGGLGLTYATIAISPCTLDGDHIPEQGLFVGGPEVLIGSVNFSPSTSILKIHPQSTARIVQQAYSASFAWGQGSFDVEPLGQVWNSTGVSWVTTVTVPTLTLNTLTTATTYATGTFVDNIPITTTNIQFYGGMQNPKTGARYV